MDPRLTRQRGAHTSAVEEDIVKDGCEPEQSAVSKYNGESGGPPSSPSPSRRTKVVGEKDEVYAPGAGSDSREPKETRDCKQNGGPRAHG
jgi:hypothetical protein